MAKSFLSRSDFSALFSALVKAGYEVIGPQEKQSAIVFEPLSDVSALPWGIRDATAPGQVTLKEAEASRCFRWNSTPQSFKPWLFKPSQTLWQATPVSDGFRFTQTEPEATPLAFFGVRSCDIAALYLQDKHFMHGPYADPWYSAQRKQLFIVAVNCAQANDTCFCVSTGDGPQALFGYDIVLDELDDGYLIEANSERGTTLLATLPLHKATERQREQAAAQLQAASQQSRTMPGPEALLRLADHLDDAQWLEIAERCLACGNCTSVCPTCFCAKQESEEDIRSGDYAQVRYWDSCFSEKHGHIAGKNIRGEISQRYRQWVLHKLVTWQSQYQRSGCVGCGRCVSWCPAAIDLVDEVNRMLGVQVSG
ncbi:4Fe-4S dicluster domain-containing protein [Alteromonas sp. CYL-A6]|uniref:4Fe-4S dicluster domain-containing protein n=1 Tax=Alteromonas nitratireducens TaxID=3390813 RepID=UPI0034BADC7E